MTYRNDHDAALARIDSLEQELEHLKVKPAPVEVVPPTRHAWKVAIAASLVAAVVGGGWLKHRASSHHVTAATESAIVHPYVSVDYLRRCLGDVLSAPGDGFDARTTDPHAGGRSVAAVAAVGATCRRELAEVASSIALTDQQRAVFQRWLAAEDTLAGDLSRIVVYYGSDPYRLDGYTTATQLWREYETDRAARDATLPAVVRELGLQPNS